MAVRANATQLGTSETPEAAGLPAQRAVTRGRDGTLWAVFPESAGGRLRVLRSGSEGGAWEPARDSEVLSPVYNASLAIDEEGDADLVYAGEGPRYLYYRKGEPLEHGWRWSIRVRIFDVPLLASVNAVAHAEHDEWKIHVVWSRGGEFSSAYYNSFTIDPEREIWLGTRERIAGPFDLAGHPAPSLDMNRETKQLWAAMWGGSAGAVVSEATYYGGRWKWSAPEPLAQTGPAEEGSVSAVWTGDAFAVSYGSDGELVCRTTAGANARAPEPAARTSLGVDRRGTVHVFSRGTAPGPLYHRTLEGGAWSEAEEVHPGPVTSFSCEQHGDEQVGVVVAFGSNPPYSVEFLSVG
jgi:hypothetical protein